MERELSPEDRERLSYSGPENPAELARKRQTSEKEYKFKRKREWITEKIRVENYKFSGRL